MLSKLKQRDEGFTIIEVLIVLAIAALILLIVFLAVPALQRNSRNNGRKNDAARVGAAVNNWVSNNNGQVPTQAASAAGIITDVGALNQYPTLAANPCGFAATQDFCIVGGAQPAFAAAATSLNDIRVATGAVCGVNGAAVAGTARQMALQYAVENGAGTATPLCLNI